jgi:2'-hydroxyisoflavone reductase
MNVLVLGGTDFLGRHIVENALARGDSVTIFNRGRTNPALFGDSVERRTGDRAGDLSALHDGTWDAAIDTSGYFPEHVHASARLLADRIAHYAFVSTLSVYANPIGPTHEDAPLHSPIGGDNITVTGETYGPLKVACENAVTAAMPGRAVIARAGFLVGPHDNVPRLRYWLRRIARGGRILAPGGPERLAQLIDARDMATFLVACAERRVAGLYNVTGEPGAVTLGETLRVSRNVIDADAEFVWASDDTLTNENVPLFDGLPYWVPEAWQSFMRTPTDRAQAAGLTTRALDQTIRDTWTQLGNDPDDLPPHRTELNGLEIACGIPPQMEAAILDRIE